MGIGNHGLLCCLPRGGRPHALEGAGRGVGAKIQSEEGGEQAKHLFLRNTVKASSQKKNNNKELVSSGACFIASSPDQQ